MKLSRSHNNLYVQINLVIITGLMIFMPFARGGVHGWIKSVMVVGVLAGLLVLVIEHQKSGKPSMQKTRLFLPLVIMFIWLIFSALLSPVKPIALESCFLALIYTGFYYLVIHSIRTRSQQRYIAYLIIGIAVTLSLIGYFKLSGITLPWWQYAEIRKNNFMTSTFGNHNHFAGYLEMSLPLLLSLFLTKKRELHHLLLLLVGVAVIASAHVFALSRGGWAALFFSLGFMAILLFMMRRFKRKKTLLVITASLMGLAILALAGTNVVERALTLTEGETVTELNGRSFVWDGTKDIIADHILTGTGPGSFAVINTQYQPAGLNIRFYHAHNDYLQYIAELGLPVIVFMIWFLWIIFYTGLKKLKSNSRQTWGFTLGALTGIVALLVHSFVDFNLRIPANALLFIALIALVMVRFRSPSLRKDAR